MYPTMLILNSFFTLIHACGIMALLLNIRLGDVSRRRTAAAFVLTAVILVTNLVMLLRLPTDVYLKSYPLLINLPVFIVFSLLSRYKGLKILFVLLTALIFGGPAVTISRLVSMLTGCGDNMQMVVRWLCYPIMIFLIWRFLKPLFNYMMEYCNKGWGVFCLVPISFCAMAFFDGGGYAVALHLERVSYSAISMYTLMITVYILISTLFKRTREQMLAQNEAGLLSVQIENAKLQLQELKSTQEQAANYRHDLRHHIGLINGFLEHGDAEKAKGYLNKIQAEVDSITPVRFCENETVNLVLSSFSGRAEKSGVTLSIKAELPQELDIPDTELCSVLSNGLENALNAAVKVADVSLRKVYLECRVDRNQLLLMIENPYEGDLLMERGVPQSKCEGHGFGCRSMLAIAEKQNGFCTFKAADGIFTLRVILPMERIGVMV